MHNIIKTYHKFIDYISIPLQIISLFALRLAVAYPFWKSGLTKWNYIKNDQLDTLYFIFEDYNVPLISTELAAWSGTLAELILPILLVFGLLTRFTSVGIIMLSGVIYLTDQNPDSFIWSASALIFIAYGAGTFSLDRLFIRCAQCNSKTP